MECEEEEAEFKVTLPKEYPFRDPQITLTNQVFGNRMLSLDDGRDLLNEVCQGPWNVGNKLAVILEKLPAFCERVQNMVSLVPMGRFHFQLYHLAHYDSRFPAKLQKQDLSVELAVTRGALLLFSRPRANHARLISWCTLPSVSSVRKYPNNVVSI